jgi:hypothetical protein
MKNNLALFGLVLTISLGSCSLEKRVYRSGLHIETLSKTKSAKTNKEIIDLAHISDNKKSLKPLEHNQIQLPDSNFLNNQVNLTASIDEKSSFLPKTLENADESEDNLQTIHGSEINFKTLLRNLKKLPNRKANLTADRKPNGQAVAGFTLSLVGFFIFGFLGILAIIFSSIGLRKTIKEPDVWNGKGLAVAGLIIGIIDVVGWLLLIALILL